MANINATGGMSSSGEPSFNGDHDNDISRKMQVPRSIRVGGNVEETTNYDTDVNWMTNVGYEALNMFVPDKILVAGEDKHIGLNEPLREMKLEKAVMQHDPGTIRVKTPPRTITLEEHFTSLDDVQPQTFGGNNNYYNGYPQHEDHEIVVTPSRPMGRSPRHSFRPGLRELTPAATEGLSLAEEVFHLRRQVAKLHRRIMSIEMDNQQRQQRETLVRTIGVAYFVIKALVWLYRSS